MDANSPLLVLQFRRRRPVGPGADAQAAAQRPDRLRRGQCRLSLRQRRPRRRSPARVPALLGRLVERFHPRLIVIACNTASTIALDHVRAALDVPIVGTVPAIKPAAAMSKTRVIGVLGTEATVRQPYVDHLAAEFAADCTMHPPRLAGTGRSRRGQAARRGNHRRRRPLGSAADVRCSRAATGSTWSSSPAPISRCFEDGAGRHSPGVAIDRRRTGHRPPHRLSDPGAAVANRAIGRRHGLHRRTSIDIVEHPRPLRPRGSPDALVASCSQWKSGGPTVMARDTRRA